MYKSSILRVRFEKYLLYLQLHLYIFIIVLSVLLTNYKIIIHQPQLVIYKEIYNDNKHIELIAQDYNNISVFIIKTCTITR